MPQAPLFLPLRTQQLTPPHDDIIPLINNAIDNHEHAIADGDILFISSKLLAIHQGRCIPISSPLKNDEHKRRLYRQQRALKEADAYLPQHENSTLPLITLTNNLLIFSAGIDESNANGHFILLPTAVDTLLYTLREHICTRYNITNLGLVATDSHSIPLKRGIVGASIACVGVNPIYDARGSLDIFGRPLKISQINIIDSLAPLCVFLMGEANEQQGLIIVRNITAEFHSRYNSTHLSIAHTDDLYQELLTSFHYNNKS